MITGQILVGGCFCTINKKINGKNTQQKILMLNDSIPEFAPCSISVSCLETLTNAAQHKINMYTVELY